jgi:E1A/CREB-binding protein
MLLYYLHGMYKEARKRMAEAKAMEATRTGPAAAASSSSAHSAAAASAEAQRTRSSRIEMAMHDWTQLLNHANEAALKETWQLPPEELFQRILVQINRSKRDILQDKYNQCKDPACPLQTRSVFIRVLKRIAESFMSCLLSMSTKR